MSVCIVCEHKSTRQRLAQLLPDVTVAGAPPDGPVDLLLRWDTAAGTDDARCVLNPKAAVEASRYHHHVVAVARTNRVPVASYRLVAARYRVYVFDLRSFAITRRAGRRWRLVRPPQRLREKLVVRSRLVLYGLGLHAGCVELSPGAAVLRVYVGPPLGRLLCRRLAAAIREFLAERRHDPADRTVVLGADPEFILRSRRTKRLVTANRFFPYKGVVGYDRLFARGLRGRPLAELRPRPAGEPEELFRNLQSAVRRAIRRTGRRIEFTAGSLPFSRFPIGGHIHFSGVPLTTRLLRALDIYLAVPLLLIDDPARSWRRRLKYGFLGDFRFKRHGRFEYRTLPSWLLSPTVTLAVLCLAKVVATEYHRLPADLFDEVAMQQAFYNAHKEPFYRRIDELWSHLEELPAFQQYEAAVLPLKRWIDARKVWPDRSDWKLRWLPRRRKKKRLRRRRRG